MLNQRAYERVCEALLGLGIKELIPQKAITKFLIKLSNKTMSETFYYYAAYLAYSSRSPKLVLEFENNMERVDSSIKGSCKGYYYECVEKLSYSQNGILVGPVTKHNMDLIYSDYLEYGQNITRWNMDHLDHESLGTISLYKRMSCLREKEFKLGTELTLLITSIPGLIKDVLKYIIRLSLVF